MQVPRLQEYLNTKLTLCCKFSSYMCSHLVCGYVSSCKNLLVKYKAKRGRKGQGNVSFLSGAVFFPTASLLVSLWIAVLWWQQLSMKLTISLLLKNTISLLFFSKHKLYGFRQSDMRPNEKCYTTSARPLATKLVRVMA